MRHTLLLAGLTCCLSTGAFADTLGFEVGGYSWQQQFSGEVASGSLGTLVDIEDDLGFDDETNTVFYALLEHPIPIIPNIKVQQTDLDLSASGTASVDIDFGGIDITVDGDVDSKIDLSHTDFTLYYELLDNWVSLDIGLTARLIQDGLIEITEVSTGDTESFEADGVLPLLYVAAKFDLPLSGLYVAADVNGLGANDDSIIDYRARIGYESGIGLGIEAGFRSFEIDYDDDDDTADLTIDGNYIGVFYHF